MKKYTTKPIDFTGCHPVIAEHLKRGEAIECWVWDFTSMSGRVEIVVGYSANNKYPYRCDNGSIYRNAELIPVKVKIKRIMPPERAIPVLIAEGWEYLSNGTLCSSGKESIHIGMFSLMGRSVDDPHVRMRDWPDCIIEEADE